jgi:hypothetical protein
MGRIIGKLIVVAATVAGFAGTRLDHRHQAQLRRADALRQRA